MSEKAAECPKYNFEKYFQKAWRAVAKDRFERLGESLAHWKQNLKKRGVAQHSTQHIIS